MDQLPGRQDQNGLTHKSGRGKNRQSLRIGSNTLRFHQNYIHTIVHLKKMKKAKGRFQTKQRVHIHIHLSIRPANIHCIFTQYIPCWRCQNSWITDHTLLISISTLAHILLIFRTNRCLLNLIDQRGQSFSPSRPFFNVHI